MPVTTLKSFADAAARTALLSGMTTLVSAHESSADEIRPGSGPKPRMSLKCSGAVLRLVEVRGEVDVVARDVQRVERRTERRVLAGSSQKSFWSGVSVDGVGTAPPSGSRPESVQSPVMQCLITSENLMSFAPVEISTASGTREPMRSCSWSSCDFRGV